MLTLGDSNLKTNADCSHVVRIELTQPVLSGRQSMQLTADGVAQAHRPSADTDQRPAVVCGERAGVDTLNGQAPVETKIQSHD